MNAYYNPQMNDINFPAGVLQPPLYDAAMDDAPNYGNTGGTIGHELTHGFDDEGRQFDAKGNLKDWWTEKDRKNLTNVHSASSINMRNTPLSMTSKSTANSRSVKISPTWAAGWCWPGPRKVQTTVVKPESRDGFTPSSLHRLPSGPENNRPRPACGTGCNRPALTGKCTACMVVVVVCGVAGPRLLKPGAAMTSSKP
ncbi:MAG: hypothetical protein IPI80_11885 [Burkholderiales bacterium]|nr:hypothetical protein [Burkholderiales bacterium]